MKNFILIIVLIFNLQSFAKAGDVQDFEIEGISVGNSAFKFFSKSEIDKRKNYVYKSKKYAMYGKDLENSNFDMVLIEFIDSGNYIVNSVIGKIFYNKNNFNECSKQENIILAELKEQFKNNASYTNHGVLPHEGDPSGKSKGSWHTFNLNDGSGIIYLECMDWAEDTGKWDNLRVTIFNEKFSKFLSTETLD